jgi:hypothetical protein
LGSYFRRTPDFPPSDDERPAAPEPEKPITVFDGSDGCPEEDAEQAAEEAVENGRLF